MSSPSQPPRDNSQANDGRTKDFPFPRSSRGDSSDDEPTPRQSDFPPSRNTTTAPSTSRPSSAGDLTPRATASSSASVRGAPTATPATRSASMPSLLASAPIDGPSDLPFRTNESYNKRSSGPTRQTVGTSRPAPLVFVQPAPRGQTGQRIVAASDAGGRGWTEEVGTAVQGPVRQGGQAILAARGNGAGQRGSSTQQTAASGDASSPDGQGNSGAGQQDTQQSYAASGGQGTSPVGSSVPLAGGARLEQNATEDGKLRREREGK